MIAIRLELTPEALRKKVWRLFELSAQKIHSIERAFSVSAGSPVFTSRGHYTSRGWTEWTQGFQFGSTILQFDATGETHFLNNAREQTLKLMPPHVSHFGVHDHGFNIVSTYGNLLRLMDEGKIPEEPRERGIYELALKCSAAVQAFRWTRTADGGGYIYSFNGPHSLFVDTMRSLRSLAVGHRLGQTLMGENDARVSLFERLRHHAFATARYSVYYGEGRDIYDVRGRVAHESIFNVSNGAYRCPNSQQGFSAFSTWTRGLAWAMLGFAEQLEFLQTVSDGGGPPDDSFEQLETTMRRAAEATCDFYIENTPTDGIPYWDTGAPGLANMPGWSDKAADPINAHEPVDSSAATIAAQGLLRLGNYLRNKRFWQAGLTICDTLFDEPYLNTDAAAHQGLILHSIYHRPNGWDFVPGPDTVPRGEASMWGDYHAREVALLLLRIIEGSPYLTFWNSAGEAADSSWAYETGD